MQNRILILFGAALALVTGCSTPNRNPAATEQTVSIEQAAQEIGAVFRQMMLSRSKTYGNTRMIRSVFLKTHGCLVGTMTVDKLEPRLQQGIFKEPARKAIMVRLSSDAEPVSPDTDNNTIGFAIKVQDVKGEKVWKDVRDSDSQDFITQNHDVFFVDNAQDFLNYVRQGSAFEKSHVNENGKTVSQIFDEMAKPVENILDSTFWGIMPYKFGANEVVKYKVEPTACHKQQGKSSDCKMGGPNYLKDRLTCEIQAHNSCFDFKVQFQKDKKKMPTDAASIRWKESESPFVKVATLEFRRQRISDNAPFCEQASFQPGHAIEDHRPLGSISEVRGIIYRNLSEERRKANLPKPTK